MKKIKFTAILLIALFCANFNGVYAQQQQKTAYEKKVEEIKKRYIKKILTSAGKWNQSYETQLYYADEDYINTSFAVARLVNPAQAKNAEAELKQAESLKTAVDFKREKEKKAQKAKEEAEKKAQQEQKKYEQSDRGGIQKEIKSDFQAWSQKGEFEKETDYTNRLQTKSKAAFDSICTIQTKIRIIQNNYPPIYVNDYRYKNWEGLSVTTQNPNKISIKKELLTYNSESEYFPVIFKTTDGLELPSKINIPIAEAEDFKRNWSSMVFELTDYDWCFIENSLCPTSITLNREYDNTKFEFPLTLENQQEITYSFDNFKIDNPYLKGYVFKYSNPR